MGIFGCAHSFLNLFIFIFSHKVVNFKFNKSFLGFSLTHCLVSFRKDCQKNFFMITGFLYHGFQRVLSDSAFFTKKKITTLLSGEPFQFKPWYRSNMRSISICKIG